MAGILPRFGPFGPLPPPYDEFGIKETRPRLAGGRAGGYDLVERMEYLYVRVVKARDLRWGGGDLDPFAEVKLGGHSCATRHIEKTASPEWNDVFAFSRERIQASFLDLVVRGRGFAKDDYGPVWGRFLELLELLQAAPKASISPKQGLILPTAEAPKAWFNTTS